MNAMRTVLDLEEHIMGCWDLVDDLQTLLEIMDERGPGSDEAMNVIIGLRALYQHRFKSLFTQFEAAVGEVHRLRLENAGLQKSAEEEASHNANVPYSSQGPSLPYEATVKYADGTAGNPTAYMPSTTVGF